MLALNYKSE